LFGLQISIPLQFTLHFVEKEKLRKLVIIALVVYYKIRYNFFRLNANIDVKYITYDGYNKM